MRPLQPGLRSEQGQALPLVAGLVFLAITVATVLAMLAGSVGAKAGAQGSVDLVALSAARSMRDDYPRLYVPPRLANGRPNPGHLTGSEYTGRARAAAREAARKNDLDPRAIEVRLDDGSAGPPIEVEVIARLRFQPGRRERSKTQVRAVAAISPPASASATGSMPPTAVGSGTGDYSGPLEYRQGKPMRPDVAAAFDRMAAAASTAGHGLVINSGYRSDAEQAVLFAANPDPRWVAPPGKSLHRCGTELDLGPQTAHGWLAANAGRFGFLKRYSWEAWHFGFVGGPEPCSAQSNRAAPVERDRRRSGGGRAGGGDGAAAGSGGIPGYVPAQFRRAIASAAASSGVPAELLSAQLLAESNFDPGAVSSAGAAGIAQFMPATAAAYGLSDRFDPDASIAAQARLMAELIGQFGSYELALAAYNAGPAPVSACGCVPAYPETQAYVARILGIASGIGRGGLAPALPTAEVRLVE